MWPRLRYSIGSLMDPVTGSLLSAGLKGGLGLVSGLLGGRSARKAYARQRADMLEDRLNTGVHAVQAAERSGFNPLTMLGAMGATNLGVQMGDTAPPLASVQLMTNALEQGMSELTGEASQKRARSELELDLAKLRLEREKVEGQQAALRQSDSFHSATQLGKGIAGKVPGQPWVNKKLGLYEPGTSAGREVDVVPQSNKSGFSTYENNWTGGPIYVLGEDFDGDISSMIMAAPQAAPQIGANWGSIHRDEYIKKHGKSPRQSLDSYLNPLGVTLFNPKPKKGSDPYGMGAYLEKRRKEYK